MDDERERIGRKMEMMWSGRILYRSVMKTRPRLVSSRHGMV